MGGETVYGRLLGASDTVLPLGDGFESGWIGFLGRARQWRLRNGPILEPKKNSQRFQHSALHSSGRFWKMMREKKSPGLKILWVWTLGTAAILIASGVRSSMREMEAMMQSDEKQKQITDRLNGEVICDGGGLESDGFVKDTKL